MKRGLTLLFILLLLPSVLAIDITLSKDSYQPGETLQAEITGNFVSLKSENILIYEQDAVHSTPTISDLIFQDNIYYFYATLPNKESNFSLKIEDAQYTESGKTKTDTIIKDFIIKQTNQSSLQINPGFIRTGNDFSINVKSLKDNQEITATLGDQSQIVSLVQDVEKSLRFSILDLSLEKTTLTIQDYTIPVFIIPRTIPIGDLDDNQTAEDNETIRQGIDISELNKTEIKEYIENLGETESLSCSDIGIKCLDNQECDGETTISSEGLCCIGGCIEKKESSMGWIWGILIIIIIAAALAFFYFKGKKKIKPKSTEDILKEKQDKFTERMKQPEPKEVSGGLGRV